MNLVPSGHGWEGQGGQGSSRRRSWKHRQLTQQAQVGRPGDWRPVSPCFFPTCSATWNNVPLDSKPQKPQRYRARGSGPSNVPECRPPPPSLVHSWPRQSGPAQQHIHAPGWGQHLAIGSEGIGNLAMVHIASVPSVEDCPAPFCPAALSPYPPPPCPEGTRFINQDASSLLLVSSSATCCLSYMYTVHWPPPLRAWGIAALCGKLPSMTGEYFNWYCSRKLKFLKLTQLK